MAESLRELIEKRNKAVHDAREILNSVKAGETLAADREAKADELLALAGNLDDQIQQKQKEDDRRGKLTKLSARLDETEPRQTESSKPGTRSSHLRNENLQVQIGKHTVSLRQGSDLAERASDDYRRRFMAYLTGDYSGRNGHERLGLVVGDDSKGGYSVPMSMLSGLIKFLDDNVFMRQLGTVLPPTTAKSVGALSYDTDPDDADWAAEVPASDISEDDTARMGAREMTPHLLTKLVKMSRKILSSSSLDLESFFNQRLGYKFAITEEQAFLSGSGAQRPLGIFTASDRGVTTSQDVTASASTSFTADDLINTLYDLKETYMRNATWLMSREGVKRCRKLKDGNGQYLWQPGLQAGQPGLILDRPYVMSEYVPSTYTTGLYVAAVGDLSHYWIQDSMNFEVQRLDELFSLKNQVGFLARKETDAMPVQAEAFRRLKLA